MRKITAFMALLLSIGMFSLTVNAMTDEDEAEISTLSDSIVVEVNELLKGDLTRDIVSNDIDFSCAFKIYVDTNVFKMETNSLLSITEALENGAYIYEVPIYIDNSTIIVNISKGQSLNLEAEFTEAEKEEILKNAGKWQITVIKYYENRIIDYANIIENAVGKELDNALLVGGLPNFRYAVALIPNEKHEEIEKLIPIHEVSGIASISSYAVGDSVYDYVRVKEYVNNLSVVSKDEAGEDGFNVASESITGNNYAVIIVVMIFASFILIAAFIARKHTNQK